MVIILVVSVNYSLILLLRQNKSAKLIQEVLGYGKAFSQSIGHHFTDKTIRLSALTGAAATEIGGETAATEFRLKKTITHDDIEDFQDTRLNVVDEISFACHDTVLTKLSDNLQELTECRDFQFGKTPIVFLGDFCQLEAIGISIYQCENSIYWEQALTHMVELSGKHRYRNCPSFQRIMPTVRDNTLTAEDRAILNSRVIGSVDSNGKILEMPDMAKTKFATYHNKNRCEINRHVFLEYLQQHHVSCNKHNIPKSAVVIKTNARWATNNQPLTFDQRKKLFENCTEADVMDSYRKRADPMLCLISNCYMMGNKNEDVKNGVANGTTSLFQKIILKAGKKPYPMQLHGYWVYAVEIDDVDHLLLRWHESKFQGTFKVFPAQGVYRVRFVIEEFGRKMVLRPQMRLSVFPVVINHATTGHKLQGKSLDELVIAEWSAVKNWVYVVLSRVRKLEGLFLTSPIPDDIDFAPAEKYLEMMIRLRNTILSTPDQVAMLYEQLRNEIKNSNNDVNF